MITFRRVKGTLEKQRMTFDFQNALPEGVTVSSATASAIDLSTMLADDSVIENTSMTVTSTAVELGLLGGTADVTYRVTVSVTLSDAFTVQVIYVYLTIADAPLS